MIGWLVPVSLFWILAALYLGGAEIRFEGRSGARQLVGLALHFAGFLGVWAVLRTLLAPVAGPVMAVVLASVGAAILLPFVGRLAFRVIGVRIVPAPTGPQGTSA